MPRDSSQGSAKDSPTGVNSADDVDFGQAPAAELLGKGQPGIDCPESCSTKKWGDLEDG